MKKTGNYDVMYVGVRLLGFRVYISDNRASNRKKMEHEMEAGVIQGDCIDDLGLGLLVTPKYLQVYGVHLLNIPTNYAVTLTKL